MENRYLRTLVENISEVASKLQDLNQLLEEFQHEAKHIDGSRLSKSVLEAESVNTVIDYAKWRLEVMATLLKEEYHG